MSEYKEFIHSLLLEKNSIALRKIFAVFHLFQSKFEVKMDSKGFELLNKLRNGIGRISSDKFCEQVYDYGLCIRYGYRQEDFINNQISLDDYSGVINFLSAHEVISFIFSFALDERATLQKGEKLIIPEVHYQEFCDVMQQLTQNNDVNHKLNNNPNLATNGENYAVANEDKPVLELIYTPQRNLLIKIVETGEEVQLCKPTTTSINHKLLSYLTKNSNQTFTRSQLEKTEIERTRIDGRDEDMVITVLGKSASWRSKEDKLFSRFLDDIKMKGDLSKLFFGKDFSPNNSIRLTNPITNKYVTESRVNLDEVKAYILSHRKLADNG